MGTHRSRAGHGHGLEHGELVGLLGGAGRTPVAFGRAIVVAGCAPAILWEHNGVVAHIMAQHETAEHQEAVEMAGAEVDIRALGGRDGRCPVHRR